MRWAVRLVVGLFVLFVVAVGGAALYLDHAISKASRERVAKLEVGLVRHRTQILEDLAWAATLEVFAPAPGGDAGTLLNPRLRWTGHPEAIRVWEATLDARRPKLQLDARAAEAVSGADWLEAEPEVWEGLDFAWMERLPEFGHWDLEKNSPWSAGVAFERFEAPLPEFVSLPRWAKLRLAKGLRDGSPEQAAREVRALARLTQSTETLIGGAVALALLGLEDDTRARALKDGRSVDGWQTLDKPARERLKRALWAVNAFASLDTPTAFAADFESLRFGRCAALNEAAFVALSVRPLVRDAHRAGYERLGRNLEGARECRLTSLRAAWAAEDKASDFLGGGRVCALGTDASGTCGFIDRLGWLPGFRRFGAEVLLNVAAPDWLNRYDAPPSTP